MWLTVRIIELLTVVLLLNDYNVNAMVRLTVLHTNDMHARFEQTNERSTKCSPAEASLNKCFGGFARLRTAITRYKEDAERRNRTVIFLNAGDTYQGTPYYNLFKWKIVAQMIDLLELDAMSLGNHEFDTGPGGLIPFIESVSTPVLACNLDLSKQPLPHLMKSVVLTKNGIKIGVVGYVTPDTKLISNPGDVEFLPEIPSIQREVDDLRKEGVKIIIALGHSGFLEDKEIARHVRGVDLVVGGHTNTFLYNGEQPSVDEIKGPYPVIITQDDGKSVPVVQAYAYTKYLGVLDLDIDDNGVIKSYNGNPVLLNSSIPEDPGVLESLRPWSEKIVEKQRQVVGSTKVLLDGSDKLLRSETNLANLITDSYVNYGVRNYNGTGWTDTPIAIVQAGGVRASIDVLNSGGIITYVDVMTVLPFENMLCRLEISGTSLLAALEWAVQFYGIEGANFDGAFLQVSGLKIQYDVNKPPGSRVHQVLARCSNCSIPTYKEVEPNKLYGLFMSNYLAAGGDGFKMFKDERISFYNYGKTDTEIFTDYIRIASPVYPSTEGRISIVDTKNQCPEKLKNSSAKTSTSLHLILFLLCLISVKDLFL